jgi:membrane protein DedA with SNARE-associated domain
VDVPPRQSTKRRSGCPDRAATYALVTLPAGIHLHHHFHGLAGGYVGVGVAALASWLGLPGPGEAAVIAAAVVAARGRLDVLEVAVVAWAGATAGGVLGWIIGLKGGRAAVTAGRPLRRSRIRALARGERFYERYGMVAVFVTPSWMAGIAGMRSSRYLPANALAALLWALAYSVGAYFAGPPVVEQFRDLGSLGLLLVLAVVVIAGGAGAIRRLRRKR